MPVQACPHCDLPNPGSSAFCSECGLALPGVKSPPRFYFGDPKFIPATRAGKAAYRLELRNQLGRVTSILGMVSVMCLLVGIGLAAAMTRTESTYQAMAAEAVVGVMFAGLAAWSRRSPLPASILGLMVYLTLVAQNVVMNMIASSYGHFQGIGIGFLDVAVIVALYRGVRNAVEFRALEMKLRLDEEEYQASHPALAAPPGQSAVNSLDHDPSFNWRHWAFIGAGAAAILFLSLACFVAAPYFTQVPASPPSAVNAVAAAPRSRGLGDGDIVSLLSGVPGSDAPGFDFFSAATGEQVNQWWTQNGIGVDFKSTVFAKAFLNDPQNGFTRVLLQFERADAKVWGTQAVIRFVGARAVTIPDVQRRAWGRLAAGAQVAIKGKYAGKLSVNRDAATGKLVIEVPVDIDESSLRPAMLQPGDYLTPELVRAIRNAPDNLVPSDADPSHDIVVLMNNVPSDRRVDGMLEWSPAGKARFDDWWQANAVGRRFHSDLSSIGASTNSDPAHHRIGVQPIFDPVPCHIWGFEGKIRFEPRYIYFEEKSDLSAWRQNSRKRLPVNGTVDGPINWEVSASLGRVSLIVHVPVNLDKTTSEAQASNAPETGKIMRASSAGEPVSNAPTAQPVNPNPAFPVAPNAAPAQVGRRLTLAKRNPPASQRDPSQDFADLVNQVPGQLRPAGRWNWDVAKPKALEDWWKDNATGKPFTADLYVKSYQSLGGQIRSVEFESNPCDFWGIRARVAFRVQLKSPLRPTTFSRFPNKPIEVTGKFAGLFECRAARGEGPVDVDVPIETDEKRLVDCMVLSQGGENDYGKSRRKYSDVIQVDDLFLQILAALPAELQPDEHAVFSPQSLEKIQAWWARNGEGKPFEGILRLSQAQEQYDADRPKAHLIAPRFYFASDARIWNFRPVVTYEPDQWILVNVAPLARWNHAKNGSCFYASGKFGKLEVVTTRSNPPAPVFLVRLKFDDVDGLIDAKLDE